MSYDYTKTPVAVDALTEEIRNSSITIALDIISLLGSALSISFKDDLSTAEETTLDGIVSAHAGVPLPTTEAPTDSDGSPILRGKTTKTGWHYQPHAISLKTSQLDSIYNKDHEGNDLGLTTIKCYDADDVELTNQASCDTDAVKTVIKWAPDHAYDIIAAKLFQATAPTSNVFIWILGKILIAAETYLTVPFGQGGINLKHAGIGGGMDTDGRSSKSLSSNDHFELISRHGAGVKHEFMFVFEIYKSPV